MGISDLGMSNARQLIDKIRFVISHFIEVPCLPVVIPFGFIVFAFLLWQLKNKKLLSIPRALVAGALGVYASGIVANTVFPIVLNAVPRTEPWYSGIVVLPFVDYEFMDAVTNMLVFVPLGVLIALVLSKPKWWKVLLVVTATSLGIELSQLLVQDLFGGGHIADASDLLSNMAGGMVGYIALLMLEGVPRVSGFIDQFRWGNGGRYVAADERELSAAR